MTSEAERAALYIHDIEQSIDNIAIFIEGMTLETFQKDVKTQDAKSEMHYLILPMDIS